MRQRLRGGAAATTPFTACRCWGNIVILSWRWNERRLSSLRSTAQSDEPGESSPGCSRSRKGKLIREPFMSPLWGSGLELCVALTASLGTYRRARFRRHFLVPLDRGSEKEAGQPLLPLSRPKRAIPALVKPRTTGQKTASLLPLSRSLLLFETLYPSLSGQR